LKDADDRSIAPQLTLVLVTLLAAWGWVFSKEVLALITPLAFMAGRFVLSGAILVAISFKEIASLPRRDLGRAILTGAILGVQTAIWALALKLSNHMGVGAFLISLGFVATPFVGALFFRIPLGSRALVSMTVAALGLTFLLLQGDSGLSQADALFGLSALVYAVYLNVNFLNAKRLAVVPNTCIQLLSAGLVNFLALVVWDWELLDRDGLTLTLGLLVWVVINNVT